MFMGPANGAGCCPDIIPPNPESADIGNKLKLFALLFLVEFFVKMAFFGNIGFGDLYLALILFCAGQNFNTCYASFFTLLAFFQAIEVISVLGVFIQRGENPFKKSVVGTIVLLVSLIMYVAGTYLCFLAYRLFKDAQMKGWTPQIANGDDDDGGVYRQGPQAGYDDEAGRGQQQQQQPRPQANAGGQARAQPAGNQGMVPFSGRGVAIG